MSQDNRALDELRVTQAVHGELLRQLWIFTLGEHSDDPVDDADACRSLSLDGLEAALDAAANPAIERLRQAAVTRMEEMWATITAETQRYVGSADVAPTAYGQRKVVEDRTRRGSRSGDDTPDQ